MDSPSSTLKTRQDAGHAPSGQSSRRPAWHHLADRFTDERECLASYLALEAAEVIGGAKPANLLNLADVERPCGRNLYRLWRRHGESLLPRAGLAARELVQRDNGALVLIFHQQRLAKHLQTPRVANFLHLAGYRQPADVDQVLSQLTERLNATGFPHEIGAILGYPLKDVAGFMGWVRLPVTCQGPWKIYGDPRPSLDVVATCRACRERMAWRLAFCASPVDCFKANAGVGSADSL